MWVSEMHVGMPKTFYYNNIIISVFFVFYCVLLYFFFQSGVAWAINFYMHIKRYQTELS